VAWISLFSFGQFALALAVMLVFLVSLILLGERLRDGAPPTWMERLCLIWPQDIYLAWISVAVIANSFQFVHVIGWSGFGIPEAQWSVLLMGVATLLGVVMAWGRGNWIFPFVVAWALRGIGARYPELPALTTAVTWLVPAGIVGGLLAWGSGLRRRVPIGA
jgi:hypothetical protein